MRSALKSHSKDISNYNHDIKKILADMYHDHFMSTASLSEKDMFHDLYEIICDVVCSDGDYIMIKREKKPYEVVRKKFLDIGPLEMEYLPLS
ncbi:MAG: hypothetical protein J6N76_04640 [Lachnospiraceae bacterium]|nr:hypothetical protein [Lachnospiraceae bacterium]